MSGYLMRLVMRGRETSEAQSIQPFVRSTSLVAERDQRIGMMGFEGFEFGEASVAEGGSEAAELEQAGVLQPPTLPGTTATSDVGVATVQRKMASPPAATTDLATPNARGVAAAAGAQMQARIRSWSSGVGAPDLADAHNVPVSPSAPPIVSPASSTGGIHPEALSLGDSQTGNAWRQFGPGAVHTRSIRQARQVDSTRLEPWARALDEHSEPAPMDSSRYTAGTGEGPRLVIGRINVEVVPPPVVQPSMVVPRPGPVTAASVSVIGPLGGGVRPSLRLSLRHR